MDDFAKIAQTIRSISQGAKGNIPVANGAFIVAEVVSIEGQTCSVNYNGFQMNDVRLTAIVNDTQQGILIIPQIGTKVLLASLDGTLNNLYVLKAQEFESVLMKTTASTFQQDDDGFLIQKGSQSLQGLLLDIVSLLKNIKVNTPTGSSTGLITPTPPQLIDIETRIKSLLKDG